MPHDHTLDLENAATKSQVDANTLTASLTPPPPPRQLPFPIVPGYEILGELGRGGMGVVYKARHLALGRTVALKMILAGAHAGPEELLRFRTEAEAVVRLQHPNIVQIHEIGEHMGLPYFSLEFCAGGSLHRKLDGKPLEPKQAAGLVEKLARALAVAHDKHVLHRDLKPHNILLSETGEPKITDFGLAKKLDAEAGASAHTGRTESGVIIGTASYMPPEQAKGQRVGPPADIYALGATLYDMLAGRPPFLGHDTMAILSQVLYQEPVSPRRLQPTVPRDLETICLACLHKEAHRRYPSAGALAEDLRRFQAGEPIVARPVGRVERVWKWAKRRPAVAALTVALIAAVAVGFGLVTWKWQDEVSARTAAEFNELKAKNETAAAKLAREKERDALKKEEQAKLLESIARKNAEFEKKEAEEQRKEALRQLGWSRMFIKKANDAVKVLLVETSQDPDGLRNLPGYEEVRLKLLEKALKYQLSLLEDKSEDPIVRESSGYTYMVVAELQMEQGKYAQAEISYLHGIAVFQRLIDEFPDNADYRQMLGASYYTFANLLRERERHGEAGQYMANSIAVQKGLVDQFPDNADYRHGLAMSYDGLGLVLMSAEEFAEAETTLKVAEQMYLKLPRTPVYLFGASMNQANLSMVAIFTNRPADGEVHARSALQFRLLLLALDPTDLDVRKSVAQSRIALAINLLFNNKKKEGEEQYRQCLADFKKLHEQFPKVDYFKTNLAQTHSTLGALLAMDKNRLAEAEKHFRLALVMQQELVDQVPEHTLRRDNLARTHKQLAELLLILDRWPEAEKQYRSALFHYEKLAASITATDDMRETLAGTCITLGALLLEHGQIVEAEKILQGALKYQNELAEERGERAKGLYYLSAIYNNLTLVMMETGRLAEAEAFGRKSLEIRQAMADKSPEKAGYKLLLAEALANFGYVCTQTKQNAVGEKHLRHAISLLEALPADLAATPDARKYLAMAHLNLVAILRGTPGAEKHSRKAVELFGALSADYPRNMIARKGLAFGNFNLALALQDANDLPQSIKHFDLAVEQFQKLIDEFPNMPGFRSFQAKCHLQLALNYSERDQWAACEDEVRKGWRLAFKLNADHPKVVEFQLLQVMLGNALDELRDRLTAMAEALEKAKEWKSLRVAGEMVVKFDRQSLMDMPGVAKAKRNLYLSTGALARTLLDLKDHVAAAKLLAEFPSYEPSSKAWLTSAVYLNHCIFLARSDPALSVDQRMAAAKMYGDKAMESLRKAVELGFDNVKLLKEGVSFLFLRDREDFQELVRQLEEKKK